MEWLKDYWWIILFIFIGMIWSSMKALLNVDPQRFLDNKPELPPHRDNNAQWEEDEQGKNKK